MAKKNQVWVKGNIVAVSVFIYCICSTLSSIITRFPYPFDLGHLICITKPISGLHINSDSADVTSKHRDAKLWFLWFNTSESNLKIVLLHPLGNTLNVSFHFSNFVFRRNAFSSNFNEFTFYIFFDCFWSKNIECHI